MSVRSLTFTLALALAVLPACSDRGLGGDDDSITVLDPTTHDRYFPIAAPARHAMDATLEVEGGTRVKLDCNTCHGAFDTFKQFSCVDSGCHPQVQTASYHDAVAGFGLRLDGTPLTDYQKDASSTCYNCHPRGTTEGAVDHNLFFPIKPGTKHGGIGCANCHIDPKDRKVFSCTTGACHPQAETNPEHVPPNAKAMVAGYEYTPTSCYACHRKEDPSIDTNDPHKIDRHDHSVIFPIGPADKHNKVNPKTPSIDCNTCHQDPVNRTNVTCADAACHLNADTATQHNVTVKTLTFTVGGYNWVSSYCKRCHADSQINRVVGHVGGTGSFSKFDLTVSNSHRTGSCLQCHNGLRIDKSFAADFKSLTCQGSGCHPIREEANAHKGRPEYKIDAPMACINSGCHPNGRKP